MRKTGKIPSLWIKSTLRNIEKGKRDKWLLANKKVTVITCA